MTENQQVAVLNTDGNVLISLDELKKVAVLEPFLNLSKTISDATGNVPQKVKPNLQRLYVSYTNINLTIKDGLSSTCATLTKYLIKASAVMKRGVITADDNKFLMDLGQKLNYDYVVELTKFINGARDDLTDINSVLMLEATGGELQGLLDKMVVLEKEVLQCSNNLTAKASERGQNQGQIDAAEYEAQICEQAIQDSAKAKASMEREIANLIGQRSHYENEVQTHRDHKYEERGSFFVFSWKVRDVHVDNGERIARENLNRLLNRITDRENQVRNWSTSDFQKRKQTALEALGNLRIVRDRLREEYADLEKASKMAEENFDKNLKEIESIYEKSGTTNVESIKMVDTLARSILQAADALFGAYARIKTHLEMISIDPDILFDSMNDALQLIAIADQCNGTNKIRDLTPRLALC